jgi:hypothetical protein
MLPPRVLCYGTDVPLPARVPLRAGPLSLFWEAGDLRAIRLGGAEVLRRVYVAIRDRNWGTVAPILSNVVMDVGDAAFRIRFDVENRQGEIHFAWRGEITGAADGAIRYSMAGVAHSTFWRNRIGFCVLHGAEAAGAAARVTHVDGTTEQGTLPVDVVPHQPVRPFADMTGMSHEVAPGVWAELRFAGETFEMEDQRNWTDASYKTFGTPLRLPYPVEVQAGARVQQAITLMLRDERPGPHAVLADGLNHPPAAPTLTVDAAAPAAPLPRLGLGVASHGAPLAAREIERLRALQLDHLRADLRLGEPDWEAALHRASDDATAVGVSLHLALFLSAAGAGQELAPLRRALAARRPPVSAFLIYPSREQFGGGAPMAEIVAAARLHLTDGLNRRPAARLVAGTNADAIFLARNLPPLDQVDALTFAIHPQEHAFDNASLAETLRTQATVVASARRLGRGLPVLVSPVTLKRRFNPHATAAEPPDDPNRLPGMLPPAVDARQMSLFAAGWTAGSLKYLALGGATNITYYETTGWRGVMETAAGSPAPPFAGLGGCVFPLYHVLADVAEFAGGAVMALRPSDALTVDGLALRKDGRLRVLAANLTAEPQIVTLRGLPAAVSTRMLDAGNAEAAMRAPEAYRADAETALATADGCLTLTLPPCALIRVDGRVPAGCC